MWSIASSTAIKHGEVGLLSTLMGSTHLFTSGHCKHSADHLWPPDTGLAVAGDCMTTGGLHLGLQTHTRKHTHTHTVSVASLDTPCSCVEL